MLVISNARISPCPLSEILICKTRGIRTYDEERGNIRIRIFKSWDLENVEFLNAVRLKKTNS